MNAAALIHSIRKTGLPFGHLKQFARNRMIWSFGHFLAYGQILPFLFLVPGNPAVGVLGEHL
jgi:hypothetical protein